MTSFVAAGGIATNGTLSQALSFTSGGEPLIVGVTGDTTGNGDNITGVTYNGVAMTLLDKHNHGAGRWLYAFYLPAPTPGTHDIVASASIPCYIGIVAESLSGLKLTGNPEHIQSSNSTTQSITTTSLGNWLVMIAKDESGGIIAGAGTTKRAGDGFGGDLTGIFDSNGPVSIGSPSLAFSGTSNSNPAAVIMAFAPAITDTITIATPAQFKTFQRAAGVASIAITGTYTGSPTSIEASFNGGAYATIVASPSGGTYSGTLSGQAAGQGTLTVRFTSNTAVLATKTYIGIGDVFVTAGDSVAEGRATNPQSYAHATLKATVFRQDDTWADGNDPVDIGTSNGSHWPLLATYLMTDQGVPIAFITTGTGSTDVYGSGSNQWAKNNSGYAEMISQVTAAAVGSNGIKGVLFHLGPNAIVNATTPTQANYNAALDTLVSNIVADIPGAPKVAFAICGEVGTGTPPDRRAAEDHVRLAILEALGDNSNVVPGPVLVEQDYSDNVHPSTDAQLLVVARRWWIAMKEGYYAGGAGFGRGPRLVSATINNALTQITLTVDRDLASGTTYGGFRVTDSGTPVTLTSVTRFSTRIIKIVLAAPASALANVRVYFASNDDAVGQTVPTATGITLP